MGFLKNLINPQRADNEAAGQLMGVSSKGSNTQMATSEQKVIRRADIDKALSVLQKYKEGKASLEQKIITNEKWYRLRQWEVMKKSDVTPKPTSAYLFNAIANKHADAMDNFPSANILPREAGDKAEASKLTDIIPVVLDQVGFEQVYSDEQLYKIKHGVGVYGVFWDASKHNGLGDIDVTKIDILNLFWEPGITDIQDSANVFLVALVDNDILTSMYPQLKNRLSSPSITIADYVHDDNIDTSEKSVVVDWYFKRSVQSEDGMSSRNVLNYVKFCNGEILYSSPDDPNLAQRGIYDHGQYPFVIDKLYPVEDSISGVGYIDIGKSPQEYIDKLDAALLRSAQANAQPRWLIRNDASVNEEEVADPTKQFVHFTGSLDDLSLRAFPQSTLDSTYVDIKNLKIDELKETSGNRDVQSGGTTSGVTAASAIAAMQEAGSKLSRDMNMGSYRAYRGVVNLCIELIRQFYDVARSFRIVGEAGLEKYIQYSNEGITSQVSGVMPNEEGNQLNQLLRTPEFDIKITAEKNSPYTRMAQNELALQFYQAGFFEPERADSAMACLDMMDFDCRDDVIKKVSQNGLLYQQLIAAQQQILALSQIVDKNTGSNLADNYASALLQQSGQQVPQNVDTTIGDNTGGESKITANAREEAASRSTPRQ
jgi:hypothetical protein